MAPEQTVRPLVPTTIRTEFGDVLESAVFNSPTVGRDLTYVPGYSDMRRARDTAIREVHEGNRKAHEIPTLPVRLQLVRCAFLNEKPDTRNVVNFTNDGYQAVTQADVGKHDWIKEMPPASTVGPNGEIRVGDCVLMVADKHTAAKRAAEERMEINRMTRSAPQPGIVSETLPGREIMAPPSAIKG